MKRRVFLERRLKDRRFCRSEDLILDIFINNRDELTVEKIARKTGLGRSTVYIHHHAVREIIPDYERYVLVSYGILIRKRLRKKNVQLKILYLDMLIFILRNKKIFLMFVRFDDRKVVAEMVRKLEDEVVNLVKLPRGSEKILKIYASEIVELVFLWGDMGFSERELGKVLFDIMYLTKTCKDRLAPINR